MDFKLTSLAELSRTLIADTFATCSAFRISLCHAVQIVATLEVHCTRWPLPRQPRLLLTVLFPPYGPERTTPLLLRVNLVWATLIPRLGLRLLRPSILHPHYVLTKKHWSSSLARASFALALLESPPLRPHYDPAQRIKDEQVISRHGFRKNPTKTPRHGHPAMSGAHLGSCGGLTGRVQIWDLSLTSSNVSCEMPLHSEFSSPPMRHCHRVLTSRTATCLSTLVHAASVSFYLQQRLSRRSLPSWTLCLAAFSHQQYRSCLRQ